MIREGKDVAILAIGTMIEQALDAAERLSKEGIEAAVCNMRFVKPLDEKLILEIIKKIRCVYTIEEHVLAGGFGAKVLEFFERKGIEGIHVKRFALPNEFIEQGNRDVLFSEFGLSGEKVAKAMMEDMRLVGEIERGRV